jgi:hypothetical protein
MPQLGFKKNMFCKLCTAKSEIVYLLRGPKDTAGDQYMFFHSRPHPSPLLSSN